MRDLRSDRARRAGVREERLRSTAGLANATSLLTLSAWRGRSGRRYVVGVHPLHEADLADVTDAVLIAVGRDGDGVARVIDVAAAGTQARERQRLAWMSTVRTRGATEMHVHRLAQGDDERHAILDDLREDAEAMSG